MKIIAKITQNMPLQQNSNQFCEFSFEAELEKDDKEITTSSNAGTAEIQLAAKKCRLLFPMNISMPHPDLVAMAALKIFSPYIGSSLELENPTSSTFAEAALKAYPNLKKISTDLNQPPRQRPKTKPAVSFSGGADSVAAASVLPKNTPLILMARMEHPELPKFESWYKTQANIETLQAMPNSNSKYVIFSDLEFMSTNGNYCIYPDTYVFTIPTILLADELSLSHVITGDIWVAFTGDETIYNPNLYYRRKYLFDSIGLPIEYPCNGISEIGSFQIAELAIGSDVSTTCQYGSFKNPCMKCPKCFRKSLYGDALLGRTTVLNHLDTFNNSPAIVNLANNDDRKGRSFMISMKYAYEKISYHHALSGPVKKILDRAKSTNLNPSFQETVYEDVYNSHRPDFIMRAYCEIKKILPAMSDVQKKEFKKINWQENFNSID